MALKSKDNETNTNEQINFDDLVGTTEAEYNENDGFETITGKDSRYEPTYDSFKNYEIDVGEKFTGYPEVTKFTNDGKSYDSLRLRLINDLDEEILDCYFNYPRADKQGFVKNITKNFDFYRGCFDFIYSILRTRGDKYVLDKDGEEYNKFKKVDLMGFAKLVDQQNKVTVQITEGNADSEYDSWMIVNME